MEKLRCSNTFDRWCTWNECFNTSFKIFLTSLKSRYCFLFQETLPTLSNLLHWQAISLDCSLDLLKLNIFFLIFAYKSTFAVSVVKLYFVTIALAQSFSFCEPPAAVHCALLSFCLSDSHQCSMHLPHLHVMFQVPTCFICATTSILTQAGS